MKNMLILYPPESFVLDRAGPRLVEALSKISLGGFAFLVGMLSLKPLKRY